jgi:hypothetical protein
VGGIMRKILLLSIVYLTIQTFLFSESIITTNRIVILNGDKSDFILSEEIISKSIESCQKYLSMNATEDIIAQEILSNLEKYCVQLTGLNVNGKEIVYMNFLPLEYLSNPRIVESMVLMLDGGSDFWQLKYDIESNTSFDFSVNGDA